MAELIGKRGRQGSRKSILSTTIGGPNEVPEDIILKLRSEIKEDIFALKEGLRKEIVGEVDKVRESFDSFKQEVLVILNKFVSSQQQSPSLSRLEEVKEAF